MDVKDPKDMRFLRKRMEGSHLHERLGYVHNPEKQKGYRNIENTVIMQMQCRKPTDRFCGVSDILFGIARLDHQGNKERNIPLSVVRLYTIFQCMETINSVEVQRLTGVGKRQAEKYVRACRIALPFLEEYFEEFGDDLDLDNFFECDI